MTRILDQHLAEITREIQHVGTLVEEALAKATAALFQRNPALAETVDRHDRELGQHELNLEERCLTLLALHHPVAADLRFVITALKVNTDLERLHELAAKIAGQVAHLSRAEHLPLPAELPQMAAAVQRMVKRSLDALVLRDAHLARQVLAVDEQVDASRRDLYRRLPGEIQNRPAEAGLWLRIGGVCRALERVGDMATNIAEDVVYMVEGEVVRHRHE